LTHVTRYLRGKTAVGESPADGCGIDERASEDVNQSN
jgi:hypothetical protein